MIKKLSLLFGLLSLAGCATDADKGQWSDAMKDLRGDNMKMHTGSTGAFDNRELSDPSSASK